MSQARSASAMQRRSAGSRPRRCRMSWKEAIGERRGVRRGAACSDRVAPYMATRARRVAHVVARRVDTRHVDTSRAASWAVPSGAEPIIQKSTIQLNVACAVMIARALACLGGASPGGVNASMHMLL